MTGERPIRLVLVEDNDVYRSSLELLLGMQGGLTVVGSLREGGSAAAACRSLDPDVVLVDYRLPGADGAAVTEAVRAACPRAAVVCLTAEATDAERTAVIAAGAVALVEKGQPIEELAAVVRRVAGAQEDA